MAQNKASRVKLILLMLAPFPAMVFFKLWAGGREPASLLVVAAFLFLYCLVIILLAFRWDRPTYFDWTVAGYFLLAAVALVAWPKTSGPILSRYAVTGIYACLFATAFFPPILGMEPFTYHYAKKISPPGVWENPIFVTINRIMTYTWSGVFAICIVLSLYPSVWTRAIIPISLILGFGLPFSLRFPDNYLRHLGLPPLSEQRRMASQESSSKSAPPSGLLPTSAHEAIFKMPRVFTPEAAGDLSAVIAFEVSGSETFRAYVHIEDGTCTVTEQPSRDPDLTILTPSDVWVAISRGELNGQQAFMEQRFKASGDLSLLLRMGNLFGK
jgi:putative sterol carrier protein